MLRMQDLAALYVYGRNRTSFDQMNSPLEVLTSIERMDVIRGYRYELHGDQPLLRQLLPCE